MCWQHQKPSPHRPAFAGEWIHATGESKRVAVCIGPGHGTVSRELVKEAAKEAVRGVGFNLVYICGFAGNPCEICGSGR
jgi:adenine-specific DNA-methyltransferase